ncbi:MAG: SAM-dependent methyltransferase [Lachnospiraceae bacterium]|nr:SAM-dependent methyltransferase [Lachnospiraceae bacterium]
MELDKVIKELFENNIIKIVLSNPRDTKYKKIVVSKTEQGFQAEKFTETQAFHENLSEEQLAVFVYSCMDEGFKQLNAWNGEFEYSIKISKKGKVFFNKTKNSAEVKVSGSNNRQKSYFLEEGTVIPPLVDMGVFTKDGKVINSMYDKFRQINKFLQFIDEAIDKASLSKLNIVDFGCGKSYLTFVVYYYLTYVKKIDVTMTGLDLKEDVIKKCRKTAEKYGYEKLSFEVGDVAVYESDKPVDMVITLHACDTATDYALYHAIRWNTKIIISVPCCQHELNGQIETDDFSILTRYGLLKERVAAIMTDAIRGNLLEYCGYKTQILEFIDFTHTPKNLLIRAVKSKIPEEHKKKLLNEVENLIKEYNLRPTLYELIVGDSAEKL